MLYFVCKNGLKYKGYNVNWSLKKTYTQLESSCGNNDLSYQITVWCLIANIVLIKIFWQMCTYSVGYLKFIYDCDIWLLNRNVLYI